MWPFDDTEEEEVFDGTPVGEFGAVAREIYSMAPSADDGLAALRDLYSEYEFGEEEAEKANSIFTDYSDQTRKKFGQTKAFDYDTSFDYAPIDMIDIIPEGDTDEDRQLSIVNKWETENLHAVGESEDPYMMQSASQLRRGISQAAVAERRKFYGSDNYLVTDTMLRGAQGLVGPLASLVGADGVNDWFEERTDPDGQNIPFTDWKVGGDDGYWSAISSGLGSGVGAVGSGIAGFAVGGLAGAVAGAGAYLGAAGAGSVRERVEESLENEATAGEAAAAGALEAVSQIGQALAGGKVFGGIAKKVASKVGADLGERVVPKILGDMALEAGSEGAGQVVSNVAENVGNSEEWNTNLGRGVPQAFVAGGVVAGGFSAYAHRGGKLPERGEEGNFTEPPEPPPSGPTSGDGFTMKDGSTEGAQTTQFQFKEGGPEADARVQAADAKAEEAARKALVPDSVLGAFPDMDSNAEGVISASTNAGFTVEEVKALNDAGLVDTYFDADGKPFDGVLAEDLWEIRNGRKAAAAPKSESKSTSVQGEQQDLFNLTQAIQAADGVPPPKRETVRAPKRSVPPPENASTIYSLDDTTQVLSDGDAVYIRAGERHLGPFKEMFHVEHSVAEKLRALEQGNAPDGTTFSLNVDGDSLVVEAMQGYLNPDLTVAQNGKGSQKVKVPLKNDSEATGTVPVFVNPISTQKGIRVPNFFIAGGKVKETGGTLSAAHFADQRRGEKERQFARNLRNYVGPDVAEEEFLQVNGTDPRTGRAAVYPMVTYFPRRNATKEGSSTARDFINKNGPIESLLYLREKFISKPDVNPNAEDHEIAKLLFMDAVEARALAHTEENPNIDVKRKLQHWMTEVGVVKAVMSTPTGQALASLKIENDLHDFNMKAFAEADTLMRKELGNDVTLEKLAKDVTDTEAQVKIVEKDVDPAEKEIAANTAAIELIEEKQRQDDLEALQKENAELKELQHQYELEKERVKVGLDEAGKALVEEIDTAEKAVNSSKDEIRKVSETSLEPTKAQKTAEEKAATKVNELKAKAKATEDTEKLAKVNEQLKAAQKKLNEVRGEIKTRTSEKRTPTAQQTRELSNAEQKLKDLKDKFGVVSKVTPEQTERVQAISRNITTVKRNVDFLKEKAKKPVDLSAQEAKRKKKLEERNQKLREAKKEGKVELPPEAKARIISAKKAAAKAQERLTRAQKIMRDALSKLDANDREQLKLLTEIEARLPPGEYRQKVSLEIFNIKARTIDPGLLDNVDMLFDYWRRNVLSGILTQVRNLSGNTTNLASTTASVTATSGLKLGTALAKSVVGRGSIDDYRNALDFTEYMRGMYSGFKKGSYQAWEIMRGERGGRAKFDFEGGIQQPNKLTWYNWINEPMSRMLSAVDAIFYRTAAEGQAHLLEYLAAEKARNPDGSKLTVKERRAYVQNQLFNTDEKLKQIQAEIDAEADLLKGTGINITAADRELAIYERAEFLRDERIRVLSDRHGERSVFQQNPEGIIGATADGITKWATDPRLTIKIKYKGRVKNFHPFRFMGAFLRTAANVSNSFLDHTPIGFGKAYKVAFSKDAKGQNIGGQNKAVTEAIERLEKKAENLTEKGDHEGAAEASAEALDIRKSAAAIEARQIAGQAIVGSAILAGFFGWAYAHKDDEDPYFAFFGATPKGKWKEWKEKGIPEYSMKIGDSYIGLQYTPLALLPAIMAPSMEAIKKGGDPAVIALNVAISSYGAAANLSFVKPLGDLYKMLSGAETGNDGESGKAELTAYNQMKTQIANYGKGFIPSIGFLQNVGRWMEAEPTETYNNLTAKMLGQLPAAQYFGVGKPQINDFGEPLTQTLWQRVSGGSFYSEHSSDPLLLWMTETGYSFTRAGPVFKMTPTEEKRYGALQKAYTGYQDILDPEQSRAVTMIAGPEIKAYLFQVMNSPGSSVFNEKRQKEINAQVSKIRARAKFQVLSGIGR